MSAEFREKGRSSGRTSTQRFNKKGDQTGSSVTTSSGSSEGVVSPLDQTNLQIAELSLSQIGVSAVIIGLTFGVITTLLFKVSDVLVTQYPLPTGLLTNLTEGARLTGMYLEQAGVAGYGNFVISFFIFVANVVVPAWFAVKLIMRPWAGVAYVGFLGALLVLATA